MKRFMIILLVITSMAAAAETVDKSDFEQKLHRKYPATIGATVEKSFDDFWSVVKNREVIFIKNDLSLLIKGDVVDLLANRSVTNDLMKVKIDWPVQDAITIGTGDRKLFVFSDPDCTYCRRLQASLDKLTNATVYIFMMPLEGLHPTARTVSQNVWCQEDRVATWRAYLIDGKVPPSGQCETPIDRNMKLATDLGVQGTPAIFFEDGSMAPGFLSTDELTKRMELAKR